jgi:hypothetical protein
MTIASRSCIARFLLLGSAALLAAVSVSAADFTIDKAGAPPTEGVPPAAITIVASEGVAVKDSGGKIVAEFWMRTTPFEGEGPSGLGIRFDTIPVGAFLGLVRYPDGSSDFREQAVPAGVYTLRYGLHPENGDHMGVAPSRDFALLSPAAQDKEITKNYGDFDSLMELSFEVGNPHPTVARLELPEGDEAPNLWENDYEHWVLDLKTGSDVVGIVVYGHSEE